MRPLDLAVILAYLAGITWFGARFRRSQHTLKDYFLGGKTAPWWAITFSIVSTETSTLTVIGTPALAFTGNFGFLQVVFGYLLGRIVIAVLFLPQYFRGEMYTAYELMQRRFGERLRRLTAGAFLLLRALAEGVRVFAISLVISIVLGTGEFASILLIICLTLFYTFEGGLKAVIWTEVVQMLLYIAGAVASLMVLVELIPQGWQGIWEAGQAAGKFQVFDFSLPRSAEYFARTYTFWAGLLGGCFLNTASHGAEQLIVQRLLAARNLRESRLALLASWGVIFLQFALFLLIGVALYAFYNARGLPAPQPADRIYPEFVWRYLPPGVAGLVIAAILAAAMSTHSATLNALASTTVMDFWRPLASARTGDPLSDAAALRLARGVTVFWEAVMLLIAWLARQWGPVLEAGLSIASLLYGSLLGAFLLGLLTRRAGTNAATVGMLAGLVVMLYVKAFTPIAWTWYALIGASTTFLAGWITAVALQEPVHD
jgi:SSS family transporter